MARRRAKLVSALAALLVSPRASATGDEFDFEMRGAYRGYDFQSEWARYQEHLFEETLRADYRGFVVERGLASYRLGMTLGRVDVLASPGRQRFYMLDYDARTDLWHDGIVPVSIFASRRTMDVGQTATPAQRTVQEMVGFAGAVVPEQGPRLRTRGYTSDIREDGPDGSSFQRHWDVGGDLSHYSGRLNGRAAIDRQVFVGDVSGLERVVDSARIDADYRVRRDVTVAAHALSRSYLYDTDGGQFTVASDNAQGLVRWTPNEELMGTVESQVSRNEYAGQSISNAQLLTSFGMPSGPVWSAVGTAGLERSTYEDDEGIHPFLGQFVDLVGQHLATGPHGDLMIQAEGGVAHVDESGVGSGMQQGGEVRMVGSRNVGGPLLRLEVGGRLGRQWDSSPRALNFARYGWEAGLESHPARGFTVFVRAEEVVFDQQGQDESDVDRYELHGIVRYAVSRDVSLDYGISQSRIAFSDAYGATLGQSVRATARISRSLVWSATGYRYFYDDDQSEPWWWNRAETELRLDYGLSSMHARIAMDLSDGDTSERSSTFAWVELRRRWQWGA